MKNYLFFEIKSCEAPDLREGENTGNWVKSYFFVIHRKNSASEQPTLILESKEYFESVNRAILAAIGLICLLENGEV